MKNKSNISLRAISDTQNCGLFLSLKKGLNEIFRVKRKKDKKLECSCVSDYSEKLSVIICTANRNEALSKAVNSLLNQNLTQDKYEIIIVNNTTFPMPDTAYRDKVIIVDEPNFGLSNARNAGAKAASGEYLLYIDDDAAADKDLLLHMFNAFKAHKKTAIIGGQIYLTLPDPTPEIFLEGRESVWSAYTVPYRMFKDVKEQYEFPYGACFGIRHSCLQALGGFDSSYGRKGNNYAGGEETVLCFKAKKYGFKIGIEPKAFVHHNVAPERFSREHVEKTLYQGIFTTYRMIKDGFTPFVWTESYVKERINILSAEISRLKASKNELAVFYKQCELKAFTDVLSDIKNKG